MECPYCNYIHDCDGDNCNQCEVYDDFCDDINDFY